jgi:hypothetical protein
MNPVQSVSSISSHSSRPSHDNEFASQRIEKEAHRIATFMQRRDSVHQPIAPNDANTNVPRKKYRAMPKMNIPEDSPVSIHVVKRDRISSHRGRLLNRTSSPPPSTPATIERPINREQLSSPQPTIKNEKKSIGFLSDIKFNTSTPRTSRDAGQRRPSPLPVHRIESKKPSIEKENVKSNVSVSNVTNVVKEIPISASKTSKTSSRTIPTSQTNSVKPISKTNPMKPTSQFRPTVSQKSNSSNTPTHTTQKPIASPSTAIVSKNAPKSISKVSTKPQSHLKPRLVSGTRSRTRQTHHSKTSSKKRSNAVEWSVKSSKLQFRSIIFSFILSNWELMPPPYVTETRWKKRIEPNLHYFGNLPNGIDRYLLGGICDGITIKPMKHKRK